VSNYLAIATVSACLYQILQNPVSAAVSGANVGFGRPANSNGTTQTGPMVNAYLYQVTPNAAYRNADLPTRRGDGTLVKKPQIALDLHYLFTFSGDDGKLEPQLMLGVVTSILNAQPLISPQNITGAVGHFGFLAGSGLDAQVERVRFTPSALTLEEFTKLWSAFFQVEYSLSVAYQASVVLIESGDTPQDPLPVQSRNLYVMPFRQPVIDQVVNQAGANLPILPSSTLLIQGSHFVSDSTTVLIGSTTVTPSLVIDKAITLSVPAAASAGVQGVQVIQQIQMGTPSVLHPGFESNAAALVLHPVITPQTPTATQITIGITPNVQPSQRVTLFLNEATLPPPASPAAYSFTLPPLTASTNLLNFTISGVQGGGKVYFVRVTVDGAESPLDLNPSSPTFGPTVTFT